MKEKKIHPLTAVRRAAVPLVCFQTADPAATVRGCIQSLKDKEIPIIEWDIVRQWKGRTEAGEEALQGYDPLSMQFPESLEFIAGKATRKLLAFVYNVQRVIDRDGVMQGIWNLRDKFKQVGATLVMVGPAFPLPVELAQDVVVIPEPLPDAAEMRDICESVVKDINGAGASINMEDEDYKRATDTLLGLSAFSAEQSLAMSCSKAGVDYDGLWSRKATTIEQTEGLAFYRGKEKYADVGGLENGKRLLGQDITGKLGITCLVFFDEIDKAMSAASSDTSGTTQDQNKVLLTYMQDNDIPGMLFYGPPGTGKTMLPKSAAGEFGKPLLMVDLGACKGSLVGQSEQKMRSMISVIHAVSGGKALFIGACNRTEGLPPELRRRFNYCSFFFDLLSPAERQSIWSIWRGKYSIDDSDLPPEDEGWTGAEIRNCCMKAWARGCRLREAAESIVPVSISAKDQIDKMRKAASGKYVNAGKPGLYHFTEKEQGGRAMEL